MLETYINGVLRDDVAGLETVKETYFWNNIIFGYIRELTGEIVFVGSLYTETRSLAKSNICDHLTILIHDTKSNTTIFDGRILLSDVSFNVSEAFAKIEITDNGLIGLIDNNKSAQCNLNVGTSKNGVTLPSITHLSNIGFVDPTSTFGVTGRDGIRLFDALDRLIRFCSDNQLSLRSDYFDPTVGDTTEPQKWAALMTGNELRLANQETYPEISFGDLIGDVNKLYNIAIAVEDDVCVRVEPKRYFKQTDQSTFGFDDVLTVNQQTDPSLFFTNVVFGSNEAQTVDYTFLEDVPFLAHDSQSFHLGGQCNLPSELLLHTKELVYDTNVIQRVLPASVSGSNDDSHDKDIFVIVVMSGTSPNYGRLTQVPYAALAKGYYNDTYSPYQVAPRWYGNIPFALFSYLGGTGNNDAEARNPNTQFILADITSPTQNVFVDFPQDVSDPGNNFQTSVINQPFPYTGAVSHYNNPSGGLVGVNVNFNFTGVMRWVFFVVLDAAGAEQYIAGAYDAVTGETPVDPVFDVGFLPNLNPSQTNGLISINVSLVMPMATGANLVVYMPLADGQITNANITVNTKVSGQFQSYDFNDSNYMLTDFDFDIAAIDRNTIIDSPFKLFRYNTQVYQNTGHLMSMEREIQSGKSTIQLAGKI